MNNIVIGTPTGEIETNVPVDFPELKRLKNLLLTSEKYRKNGRTPPKELVEEIRRSERNFMSPIERTIRDLARKSGQGVKFNNRALLTSPDLSFVEMLGSIDFHRLESDN